MNSKFNFEPKTGDNSSMLINGIEFPRRYVASIDTMAAYNGNYIRVDPGVQWLDRTLFTTHYSNIQISGTSATSAQDAITKLNTTFNIGKDVTSAN